ncbi:MAG: hypothetical protein K6T57_09650 [Thermaceae bacterium]|nr:hypothetical protein [Thermaceae bacterium]
MRLELESLLEQADPRVLQRGQELFRRAEFLEATVAQKRYRARLRGSAPYPYRSFIDLKEGTWGCTCPYTWGPVCKHVVALALAILEAPEVFRRVRPKPQKPGTLAELRGLSDGQLVELLWALYEARPEPLLEFAHQAVQREEQ